MHEELVFPIECRYEQVVWSKYITCKGVIRSASDKYFKYDAMDNINLIPSLVKLVNECKNATDNQREEVIKKWIRQYGFLTSPNRSAAEGFEYKEENIEKFWSKAKQLTDLWDIYRMVTNRELDDLRKIVSFTDTRVPDINGNNDNPLRYYQVVAFSYIKTEVQRQLRNVFLTSRNIVSLESSAGQDFLKIFPIIKANTLLQALYLQFYIILSTPGKKICEGCFRAFVPSRRDQKYCTDTCKNTAKSRRYRARRILQLKKEVD